MTLSCSFPAKYKENENFSHFMEARDRQMDKSNLLDMGLNVSLSERCIWRSTKKFGMSGLGTHWTKKKSEFMARLKSLQITSSPSLSLSPPLAVIM